MKDLSKIDPKHNIIIKGARLHNLKNIDVVIPRNKFTVITGLSGSGKSSLAYDTLYAEGQRRYVESLSSYARQFMGKLNKPKVDYIKGISPAIAVEQKINTSNPRSTVGTKTEIYDYLKLLFARIGKTYSPKSKKIVKKDSTSDVVEYIVNQKLKSKLLLLAPVDSSSAETSLNRLDILKKQGRLPITRQPRGAGTAWRVRKRAQSTLLAPRPTRANYLPTALPVAPRGAGAPMVIDRLRLGGAGGSCGLGS